MLGFAFENFQNASDLPQKETQFLDLLVPFSTFKISLSQMLRNRGQQK